MNEGTARWMDSQPDRQMDGQTDGQAWYQDSCITVDTDTIKHKEDRQTDRHNLHLLVENT